MYERPLHRLHLAFLAGTLIAIHAAVIGGLALLAVHVHGLLPGSGTLGAVAAGLGAAYLVPYGVMAGIGALKRLYRPPREGVYHDTDHWECHLWYVHGCIECAARPYYLLLNCAMLYPAALYWWAVGSRARILGRNGICLLMDVNMIEAHPTVFLTSRTYASAHVRSKEGFMIKRIRIAEDAFVGAWGAIAPGFSLGRGSSTGWASVFGPDVVIGERVTILGGVRMEGFATVGDRCIIGANSYIMPRVAIAERVVIGRAVTIASGVRIGRGARVGDGAFIGEGVVLAEGAQVPEGARVHAQPAPADTAGQP